MRWNDNWKAAVGVKPSHFKNVIFFLPEFFLAETIVSEVGFCFCLFGWFSSVSEI